MFAPRTIIEPFRIKSVEPIRQTEELHIRLRPDGILEYGASCAADVWQGVFELRRVSATPSP